MTGRDDDWRPTAAEARVQSSAMLAAMTETGEEDHVSPRPHPWGDPGRRSPSVTPQALAALLELSDPGSYKTIEAVTSAVRQRLADVEDELNRLATWTASEALRRGYVPLSIRTLPHVATELEKVREAIAPVSES